MDYLDPRCVGILHNMNDWTITTRNEYAEKGLGARVGWGKKPGLIIVDLAKAFTDPSTGVGANLDTEVAAVKTLLDAFRANNFPVIFMTVAYRSDYSDAATFIKKVPALSVLVEGSEMVEIDERIAPLPSEPVVTKKFCLLYTSPSPRDLSTSRMPSSA